MTQSAQEYLDEHIIGRCPAIRRVKALIRQIAPTELPILIEGETGTGKELVAEAVHQLSGRRGPLVAVNVCAYPGSLFEAALFGHARGAFTGAHRDEPGLLAEARDGTLFLDEIGALPLDAQAKLLRVVETRTWRRLGESTLRRGTFREVAATNVPLSRLVDVGHFRADLAFRLRGMPVRLPPLRSRGADLSRLAMQFARQGGSGQISAPSLSRSALRVLHAHDWPGNIRELRAIVESAACTSATGVIDARELEAVMAGGLPVSNVDGADERILAALASAGGDAVIAAALLGVSRATVYRWARIAGAKISSFRLSDPSSASEAGARFLAN